MIDEDFLLKLLYIFMTLNLEVEKVPFFDRATIICNTLEYFETLNIKIMISITQKENPARYDLFES